MGLLVLIKARTKRFRALVWQSDAFLFKSLRPLYKLIRFTYYISLDKSYRHDRLNQIRYSKYTLQPNSFTAKNRYPELFNICKGYFAGQQQIKILSFGCSSGEEAFSLSEYLPDAKIVGVDINKYCLNQANKHNSNPNIIFYHCLSPEYLASNDYSAIFCLAVLQHSQNRSNIETARKFTFKRFEQQIILLDKKLKPGGLLFIDNCDFNFLDTAVSSKYTILAVENNNIIRDRPLFSPSNQKLTNQTNNKRVFVKIGI